MEFGSVKIEALESQKNAEKKTRTHTVQIPGWNRLSEVS